MKKKFICTVCGYVHEGNEAPEKCPQCGAPRSKFKELDETALLQFVTEHEIGAAKGSDDEMIKDLTAHFNGECTEVGMYLAMSRQADREGYPEVAEAFKRYAFEVPMPTRCVSQSVPRNSVTMQSMTPFMKWLRTRLVTVRALKVFTTDSSRSNQILFIKKRCEARRQFGELHLYMFMPHRVKNAYMVNF